MAKNPSQNQYGNLLPINASAIITPNKRNMLCQTMYFLMYLFHFALNRLFDPRNIGWSLLVDIIPLLDYGKWVPNLYFRHILRPNLKTPQVRAHAAI
jgi:hypothetical protein